MRVKEGKYVRIIRYSLGDIMVAEIRDDQTYFHSNHSRNSEQGLVHYIWLTLGNFGDSERVSSVAAAIKKIKAMVGGMEAFSMLTKTDKKMDETTYENVESYRG
jgi:hypothetical protein